MTQPPYYGTPADPYAPQPPQQYPPQGYQPVPNGYAPAPQGYSPPQQYPPQYAQPGGYPGQNYGAPQQGQPQGPPQPVGAKGTVDGFFKQPQVGGGKGVSWLNKQDGYTYIGVVNRTPGDADLFQDSDPNTKALKFWRDNSPKMVMPVPLDLVWMDQWQQQEYADGEARVFLRGEMLKEVTRAMAEAGLPDGTVPQQGALMVVKLTGRKPGRGTIPANQYAVQYLPAGTWEQDPNNAWIVQALAQRQQAQAPQQAPYQQPVQQTPQQWAPPMQAAPNPQQYAAPQYGAPAAYDPNQAAQSYGGPPAAPNPQQYAQPDSQPTVAAPAQPAYAPNPQAPVNQGPAPSQPAAQPQPQYAQPVQGQLPGMPPQPPVPPQGMPPVGVSALTPEKQNLLANLQGQAPQAPQGQ